MNPHLSASQFQGHVQRRSYVRRLGRHSGGGWASGRRKGTHASGTGAQSGLVSDGWELRVGGAGQVIKGKQVSPSVSLLLRFWSR